MRMLRKAQCEGQLAARPTPADIADYLERAHAEAHPTLDAVERTDRRGRPLWYRGRADVRITWTTDTNMSKTSRTWVSRLYAALRYPRPSGRTRVSRRSGSAR